VLIYRGKKKRKRRRRITQDIKDERESGEGRAPPLSDTTIMHV